jgi:hypothetical protein
VLKERRKGSWIFSNEAQEVDRHCASGSSSVFVKEQSALETRPIFSVIVFENATQLLILMSCASRKKYTEALILM